MTPQSRFEPIFEILPLPTWEEDFSELKLYLETLGLLGKEEKEIKSFFEDNPDKLSNCLSKIKIKNFNQACLKLHHAQSKEILLDRFNDIFTAESLNTIIHQIICICQGLTDFNCQTKAKTLDGEIKDIHFQWCVVPGYENSLESVLITTEDISRRLSFERQLIQNQERLHEASQLAQLGYWELDIASQKIQWSDQTYLIWEVKKDEILLTPEYFFSTIHPEDLESLQINQMMAVQGDVSLDSAKRIILPNKGFKWVRIKAKKELDQYGKVKKLIGTVQDVTDSETLKQSLQARNIFIETALNNLPIGIALNEIDSGVATLMNKQFTEIYGWPEETLRNIPTFFEKVYPNPEYREKMITRIMADISSRDPERMAWSEIEITTQHGEKRIVSAKNIPIYDQNIMISTVVNETEKIKAERELKTSNERFIYAASAISDAIWDWDLEAKTVFWGSGYKTLFGYDYGNSVVPEDLWETKVHPDDFQFIMASINDARANPKIERWKGEYRFLKQDGSYAFVIEHTVILRNQNGKPRRMIGALQDVTDKKEAEHAIIQKTKYLETISKVVESLLSFESWESVLARSLKLMGEAAAVDRVYYLQHFEDQKTHRGFLKQEYEWVKEGITPELENPEFQAIPLDDFPEYLQMALDRIPYQVITSQVSDSATREILEKQDIKSILQIPVFTKNTFKGFLGFDDCTQERVWTKDEISFLQTIVNNFGAAIEKQEFELSLQQVNEQLKDTNRSLEISNSELEQFAYVASHDLQEPLRMVSSFLSLLEKKYGDQLDDKAHTYIQYSKDGAARMRNIILDLLEFSRVGRAGDLKVTRFDPKVAIQEAMSLISQQIQESKAEITINVPKEVQSKKSAFIQLIQNLLSNAIKYQNAGNIPRINIAVENLGDYWRFAISDNGIGIAPEYQDKIFVIFQRLHDKSQYSGTGIGLAICKKIVEFLGGEISVSSELSKGSTFYFTLPKR
jgi:PAS domain S-box-containing protein